MENRCMRQGRLSSLEILTREFRSYFVCCGSSEISHREPQAPSSGVYQGTLLEAVEHFQARHGIEPTGLIDEETLNALNIPIVVVDKGYGHTPSLFAGEIQSVNFRPYWDVPLRMLREESIPRIQESPAYLGENSYDIVDREGKVIDDEPGTEEVIARLRSGQLGIRERPGVDNALGLVKFDFSNQSDIYMHGTPAMELASKSRRDSSHGCIRVEDPVSVRNGCCETSRNGRRNILQTRCTGRRPFACHS